MADKNQQNDLPIDLSGNKRSGIEFLPKYFRTLPNKKFLASTIDQMIQSGVAEKLNAYYGRKNAKAINVDDSYITDVDADRQNYQLEPATIIQDELGNVEFYRDYIDYINMIDSVGGETANNSKNNEQEFYAWNPHINWDKFVNFREYYWLPFGPQIVDIFGQSKEVVSTYSITATDEEEQAYVFTPNGFTRNPTLKLYRGQTYRFEIDAPGNPIAFSTDRQFSPPKVLLTAAKDGVRAPGRFDVKLFDVENYDYGDFYLIPPSDDLVEKIASENISNIFELGISGITESGQSAVFIEKGVIEFTIPNDAPDVLYYVSKNDIDYSGSILIFDIEENTEIDVENEILGKKTYRSANGVDLINGMRVRFGGDVNPAQYQNSNWYVEGVGDRITLVNESDLEVFSPSTEDISLQFDDNPFDRVTFDEAAGFSATKDYIVSNRASPDKNQWARTNKWTHKNVIEKIAEINGTIPELDESRRAIRPIIEFNAGIKLANFGTQAKGSVDLIDTFTTDIFSVIEGSTGYNIDGISLVNGMKVLFTADTDILANNRIYEVKFITFNNNRQITLVPTEDTNPQENEVVYVRNGETNRGKMFYFNGANWLLAQNKTSLNQAIIFDLYDNNDVSIFDYPSVIDPGTKLFSYEIGTGTNDVELGFPIKYRIVENSGDIVFNFNMLSDNFQYQVNNQPQFISAERFRIKKYIDRTNFVVESAWKKANSKSYQNVIRLYNTTIRQNDFSIDIYDNILEVQDLWHRVYVNNKLQKNNIDYTLVKTVNSLLVRFNQDLDNKSIVEIKTRSNAKKNKNGYYEIPINLERNPLNDNPSQFTFGEVSDHLNSIVEELQNFDGSFPGKSNLDNLGNITPYGKKFVQHSGPINLSSYHLLSKEHSILKAISKAQNDYGKFKREFIQFVSDTDFDGEAYEHVDNALQHINRSKTNAMPYYFTDMVGNGNFKNLDYTVVDPDNNFFALPKLFNLEQLSNEAVYVYLNNVQLVHDIDYVYTDEGFVQITKTLQSNDSVELHVYENTDGCFVPPTPTKLGLYPKYVPKIYIDTTYLTPTKVIQGHDGSITKAYNDYRDDLILELELRIFNNIKIDYNKDIIDIHNFVPGLYRETSFSREEINNVLISDFVKWLELVGNKDYTNIEDFYDLNESFTYNYANTKSPSGKDIRGFWRAVYKQAYDTDRPHSHPWEMLGFTVKPTWWEEQYGPAPYTSDNLIMWTDIAEGKIFRPGRTFIIDQKYVRPDLLVSLPVDAQGNLVSPLTSGFAKNFSQVQSRQSFKFGDVSPIESAWRRNSDYPFALLKSWIVLKPSEIFGLGFDRSRIIRDDAGELVYSETNRRITLADIKFPNTIEDNERIQTSGLVNYISNYLSSDSTIIYENYRNNIKSIKNQLAIRIAGFTDKSKFNMILDSRSPLNQGNVFVPQENFNIFLNSSSPTRLLTYSGVLIEKRSTGFVVRGYNKENPIFNYLPPIGRSNDPAIKVGGVSEDFLTWTSGKSYTSGQIVEFESSYYRATEAHTATETLEIEKFVKLPGLPIVGGVTAFNRKLFETTPQTVQYGTVFTEIQEVVDFLLGYGEYLSQQGFRFNYFNEDYNLVENWLFSVKEFLFWTTQNWSAGAIITLSPGATSLSLQVQNEVVDDLYNGFFDYFVVKSDGQNISSANLSIDRTSETEFEISVKNTNEGIYGIKIPLVQKEHIVLLDNKTVFNDIIYDLAPGYRQERIKILGYRTDNWNGSFNIPGFIYDNVRIKLWSEWTDYDIGDVVKYKEFYYVSLENIPGSAAFDFQKWQRLNEKPESKLQGNLEYKTNQFADFYDLDTDNFDIEQQKLAQHLIGYQKRQYLQNIINDDVSQYKFYQGMIKEKGSTNSLTKLFDRLSNADKDSLEFYEEWAIKLGQYGAVDGVEEVEFTIDESLYRLEPQPVQLVDVKPTTDTNLNLYLTRNDVYLKPNGYDHTPFPLITSNNKSYVKTAGYVHKSDVQFVLETYDNILTINIDDIDDGSYFWIGNKEGDWDVLRYNYTKTQITSGMLNEDGSSETQGSFEISFNRQIDVSPGDIIGFTNTDANGFYKVVSSGPTYITLNSPGIEEKILEGGFLAVFKSHRYQSYDDLLEISQSEDISGIKVWIDDNLGKWGTYQNKDNISFNSQLLVPLQSDNTTNIDPTNFVVNNNNTLLFVGNPDENNGNVLVFSRPNVFDNFTFSSAITCDENFQGDALLSDNNPAFGKSVTVSPDSKYVVIGSPEASNVKTNLVGEFSDTETYLQNNIVEYLGKKWRAKTTILPKVNSRPYNTFNSTADIINTINDSSTIEWMHTGQYPFSNVNTDHILLRVPQDIYDAVDINQQLALYYINAREGTVLFQEPFNGTIPEITNNYINNNLHTVEKKIDAVIYIDVPYNRPQDGDILRIDGIEVTFTIANLFEKNGSYSLYIHDIFGTLPNSGLLYLNDLVIGEYELMLPGQAYDDVGRYFKIPTVPYTSRNIISDSSDRLVFRDVLTSTETLQDANIFYALEENNRAVNINSNNDLVKFAGLLSFTGNVEGVPQTVLSDKWILRLPAELKDVNGTQITYNTDASSIPNFKLKLDPITTPSLEEYGLENLLIRDQNEFIDLWDGWIDVEVDTPPAENTLTFIYPQIGNTISDINGNQAVVQYIQTKGNIVRCFVKGTQGHSWPAGADFNDSVRVFLTDPSRLFVETQFGFLRNSSLYGINPAVGFIGVIQESNNLPVPTQQFATDISYWLYDTETLQGLGIPAQIPGITSKVWELTTRLTASTSGTSDGFTNEGLISIYEKDTESSFIKVIDLLTDFREDRWIEEDDVYTAITDSFRFGSKVVLTKDNQLYTLFVQAVDRIIIIKNGTDSNGVEYNWEVSKDPNFRGTFIPVENYSINDIILYNDLYYRAKTNHFDSSDAPQPTGQTDTNWELILEPVDVGYISAINIKDFKVSNDGKTLVAIDDLGQPDVENQLRIYRLINGTYRLDQTIELTNNIQDYLETFAINTDASMLAIGKYNYSLYPTDNAKNIPSAGIVEVYKFNGSEFALTQTLQSPNVEVGERFGHSLDFSQTNLVIGSAAGDVFVDEIFSDGTYFDNNFTKFKQHKKDYGKVYHFEYLENTFIFSSLLDNRYISDTNNIYSKFGYDLVYNNGHMYLPFNLNSSSEILEYKKIGNSAWSLIREQNLTVDTNKIKKTFISNKKTNSIVDYIDFIDPIQGRFAGIVEQELNYKTYYDPAIYDFGNNTVNVNSTNPWGPSQVGKVWLDLTNLKFYNPYHTDVAYATNTWNELFEGSTVDIYEWVESDLLPSEWNEIADTVSGVTRGISGVSKYDDTVYCERKVYDNISQTFTTKYYFWVSNKKTIPNIEGRNLNISELGNLIRDPAGQGYKFVALISNNKFAMFNCKSLITGTDCTLHISYYTIDNQQQNMHSEYQLISEGLYTSRPKDIIIQKWFDSLVGYDQNNKEVPDPTLSPRQKYGNLNRPRQSWFVNKIEALKQFIERVNLVLASNLIVDNYDISALERKDPIPTETSQRFDLKIDTEEEIRFIYTNNLEQAVLEPVIENGRIISVRIINPGKGYKVPPTIEIVGSGEDAVIELGISETGRIILANVLNSGYGYLENTRIVVRPFSVLVTTDNSISGKWSIYQWNSTIEKWNRVQLQDFDVSLYWSYTDWYATGYNQFTEVDFIIDGAYDLPSINVQIGEIVKINNIGSGGWLLLEKENDLPSDYDYSINYKTIGRQNGTLQFNTGLYDYTQSTASFDGFNYDVSTYDNIPIEETKIIVRAIKEDLLVDELETEFNNLFFASLRYVLSEQLFVDWFFKTSFVKVKHNFGSLDQKVTYQNDNLASYEDYVNEVKPFKTKIREYLSAYDKVDNTSSIVSDFDLLPKFNPDTNRIEPPRAIVVDNTVQANDVDSYPNKHWFDNLSFYVDEIQIKNNGSKYTTVPQIILQGGGGTGATAKATVNAGKVTNITVTNPGSGYITPPTVIINGSIQEGGTAAEAYAVLKNDTTRKIKLTVKFDRTSGELIFDDNLVREEIIQGFSNRLEYNLKYPIDLVQNSIRVFVAGEEILSSAFSYNNVPATLSYTSEVGQIKLSKQMTSDAEIKVIYNIKQGYLNVADRIKNFYNPTTGMYGNELGQLMTGVDYGGVEVRSFDFNNVSGWDSKGWYNDIWDTYDVTFEDVIIPLEMLQTEVTLPQPLEDGVEYNVYIGVQGEFATRIDDSNWVPQYNTLSEKQSELLILQSEEQDLTEQRIELVVQLASLSEEKSNKEDEIADLFTQLNLLSPSDPEYFDIIQEINTLQGEVAVLDTQISVLNNQRTFIDGLIEDKQTQVSDVEEEIINLQEFVANYPLTIDTAGMKPIIGDGETTTYSIPERFNDDSTTKTIIFRKTTSDGTFIPDESAYDTALTGGTFEYASAKGIAAGDIIVDGDGFVTPTTSGGTEEQVPGQIIDTVDIKVYDRIGEGSAMIVSRNYTMSYFAEEKTIENIENSIALIEQELLTTVDETEISNLNSALQNYLDQLVLARNELNAANTPLNLGTLPATADSVILSIDNKIQPQDSYEINFFDQTVQVLTPPPAGSIVSTTTFTTNGANILDIGTFVADGSTTQFLTGVEWQDELTIFVAVNGVKYSAISSGQADRVRILQSDETYDVANSVILDFAQALQQGDIVNYAIYASSTKTFSEVSLDRFVADGSTRSFTLSETPFEKSPIASNVVAIVGDKLLSPGYYENFTITGERRYELNLTQYPPYSLTFTDESPVIVKLNNIDLEFGPQYVWVPENSAVELKPGIGEPGDFLEVYVKNSEYIVEDDVITFNEDLTEDSEILVYQFSNHDVLDIQRSETSVIFRDWFTPGDEYFEDYAPRTRGLFKLLSNATEVSYVWVAINGTLLIPNVDYYLTKTKDAVQIIKPIKNNDKINIVHFSGQPVSSKFGFRQFKDMLNRTHYKRLNNNTETRISKDVNYFDLRIEVDDASVLASPNRVKNLPGVVFVNGERIEYMVKEGNILRQLRRGTLGTSVNEFIPAGSIASEQGQKQTIPYQDKTYVSNFTSGLTQSFNGNGIDTTFKLDKKIDDYRQILSGILTVTITTVNSLGFTVTEETTDYSLGTLAGDEVIVFNTPPQGTIEIALTQQTSFNLDFNPGQGGVNEFEVFVAGTRLRKNSIEVFDPTANDPSIPAITPAEFNIEQYTLIDGTQKTKLILTVAPIDNSIVTVIRKQGQTWTPAGVALKDANTLQGVFLREASIDLPK